MAYSFMINPQSKIALKQVPLGSDQIRGFAIVATCEILKDATIHELIGMIPSGSGTPDSHLSDHTHWQTAISLRVSDAFSLDLQGNR